VPANQRWCSAAEGWRSCHQHTGAAPHLRANGTAGSGQYGPIVGGGVCSVGARGHVTALQVDEITLTQQCAALQRMASNAHGWEPWDCGHGGSQMVR